MSDETPDIESLKSADAFRQTQLPKADGHVGNSPYWHGWVIVDAFLAGMAAERERAKGFHHD